MMRIDVHPKCSACLLYRHLFWVVFISPTAPRLLSNRLRTHTHLLPWLPFSLFCLISAANLFMATVANAWSRNTRRLRRNFWEPSDDV